MGFSAWRRSELLQSTKYPASSENPTFRALLLLKFSYAFTFWSAVAQW